MARGKKVHFYRGHYIYPGRIADGTNDVLGTWYVAHEDCDELDTSGHGHANLAAAKQSIDETVGKTPWKYTMLEHKWVARGFVPNKDWTGSEITIITRRGQRHVRKVTSVIQKVGDGQGEVLLYVGLEPDHQIERDARKHSIDARLEKSELELSRWSKYFEGMHNDTRALFSNDELVPIATTIRNLLNNLQDFLVEYRKLSVPRKHPLSKWMESKEALNKKTCPHLKDERTPWDR